MLQPWGQGLDGGIPLAPLIQLLPLQIIFQQDNPGISYQYFVAVPRPESPQPQFGTAPPPGSRDMGWAGQGVGTLAQPSSAPPRRPDCGVTE